MKTFYLIWIACLLLVNASYGQDTTVSKKTFSRGYVFVSAGIGMPTGNFGDFDKISQETLYSSGVLNDFNIAGEARTGFSAKAGGGYMFTKNIGIAGQLFRSSFKTAEKTFQELFGSVIVEPSFEEDYKSNSWTATGFLIGAEAELPLGGVTLGLRIMGGMQSARSPEVTLTISETDYSSGYYFNEEIVQPQLSNTVFVFNEGIDVRLKASKSVGIFFCMDYLTGKHSYDDDISFSGIEKINGSVYNIVGSQSFNYSKRFSFLSITSGLAFMFR